MPMSMNTDIGMSMNIPIMSVPRFATGRGMSTITMMTEAAVATTMRCITTAWTN